MGQSRTARAMRTIAALGCAGLMLAACDADRALRLLNARLIEDEPAAAAEVPADRATPTDRADRVTDDTAGGDTEGGSPTEHRAASEDATAGDDDQGADVATSVIERQIFDRLNETRRDADVGTLKRRTGMSDGARAWACEMARTGEFRHADLRAAGVSGENIAWGQQSAAEVHEDWMNSAGHRDNRINARWTEYGIGVCTNGSGQLHYTERFR